MGSIYDRSELSRSSTTSSSSSTSLSASANLSASSRTFAEGKYSGVGADDRAGVSSKVASDELSSNTTVSGATGSRQESRRYPKVMLWTMAIRTK